MITLSKYQIDILMQLDKKERVLSEIIVWLKSKGYYEECMKDLEIYNHTISRIAQESNERVIENLQAMIRDITALKQEEGFQALLKTIYGSVVFCAYMDELDRRLVGQMGADLLEVRIKLFEMFKGVK